MPTPPSPRPSPKGRGSRPHAIILLSGGLDSATTLAIAREMGFDCHAITFDYGQRHRVELDAAIKIAQAMYVREHVIMSIDLRAWGGSALTDARIDVPKDRKELARDASQIADDRDWPSVGVEERARALHREDIPVTYVPARNTIFLSFALAMAEVRGADDIFIGVNAVDYSGYPDCRPEFIRAFETMANLATKAGVEGERCVECEVGMEAERDVAGEHGVAGEHDVGAERGVRGMGGRLRIHTPLIDLTKAQIIRRGIELGVDYGLTRSCYDPDPKLGVACWRCDSCLLRAAGFREAGVRDPLLAG